MNSAQSKEHTQTAFWQQAGNFIAGSFPGVTDERARLRLKCFNAFAALGIVIVVCAALFVNLPDNDTILLARDAFVVSLLLAQMILSRHIGHYELVFHITIFVLVLVRVVSLYEGITPALYWLGLMPIMAYLLLGRLGGMLWTVVLGGLVGGVYVFDQLGYGKLPARTAQDLPYALLAMVTFSLVLFVYEGINLLNQRLIADRDTSLQEANDRLERELADNKHLSSALSHSLDQARHNNKRLEELGQQLAREKRGIEQRVIENSRQLHEEQARLKASINSLDSGFLMTLRDGRVMSYNPSLVKLFGLIDESKNAPSSLHIHDIQQKMGNKYDLESAIRQCLATGGLFGSGEVDVEGRVLSLYGAPIMLDGRFDAIGVVILVNDITEIKVLERAKDEFVSIASHELRTPLTAIRGNSAMLIDMYNDQIPDDGMKQMLQDIKDGSIRLIDVVNQFLSMSRLEQGRMVFEIKPMSIPQVATRVISNLKSLADQEGLVLRLDLPDDLPEVMSDGARLEEIVTNLVGNAIKYTERGSVTVQALVEDDYVKVRVIDTGRGIDAASQHLLFRKFQQAASNILTRDDSHSTGLGLYITKLLVEQMKGTIGLEHSELGVGSTFSFTLPTAKAYNKHTEATSKIPKADKEQ